MKAGLCAIESPEKVDAVGLCRYVDGTSLLFVSTAERGAASSEAALAFFTGPAAKGVPA